jgi:hypothetical protein
VPVTNNVASVYIPAQQATTQGNKKNRSTHMGNKECRQIPEECTARVNNSTIPVTQSSQAVE